ncbi:DNA repair protein [Roseivivax sp. CAU 1761]
MIQFLMQRLTALVLATIALSLLAYTIACALGRADWLALDLTFGATVLEGAGPAVQIALTALAVGLCFFLPSNARVMALETSHRRFQIGMQDVARAYQVAHAADRGGAFQLKSEFDSVRERMAFLRDHPDLADLEPSVLEVASQMSHLSRELAAVYSDRNVARARDFLIQRQQEIEDFNLRLETAKRVANEIRLWLARVETDEAVAESQLARLCDELTEVLPELHEVEEAPSHERRGPRVVADAEAEAAREAAPHQDDSRIVSLLHQRAAE